MQRNQESPALHPKSVVSSRLAALSKHDVPYAVPKFQAALLEFGERAVGGARGVVWRGIFQRGFVRQRFQNVFGISLPVGGGMQIGAGSNPNWHQPSDVFTTYTDKDFRLGLNAAQTTLSAIAQLTGVSVVTK